MIEQELASIIKFVLDATDDPAPYYHNIPEDFFVPAVYFPTPEITTGGETFLTYRMEYDKTVIRPVTLGIDFVGYRIWATHRKLKKQTARRMIRKVKTMCQMVQDGEMSLEEFERSAASYSGTLLHCNCYGLRERLNRIYESFAYGNGGNGSGYYN